MSEVVLLLTPIHTGTHFVRMLLESHPSISLASADDYRIDPTLRPDSILPGVGGGWIDTTVSPEREPFRGRMLGEYFEDLLKGEISVSEFHNLLKYRETLYTEATYPLRISEHALLVTTDVFRSLGLTLEPKDLRYRLYRGHYQPYFDQYNLAERLQDFRFVTTIRHPLRSILSILRRTAPEHHDGLVEYYFAAVKTLLSLPNAFVFCTDTWQATPTKMAELFTFLDLPITQTVQQYINLRPQVNVTLTPGDEQNQYTYCHEHPHPTAYRQALSDVRYALDKGAVHPLLIPHWKEFLRRGLWERYEQLGYRLDDLDACG